jgi:broad specificity phosphatase PhoE
MANGKAWKRIGVSSSILLALLLAGITIIYWKSSTTVVLVVRHAERNNSAPNCTALASCPLPNGNPANPPLLAPEGETRATTLAHVVEDTGIQAIYASCFCRTQQTVGPTATNLGLTTNLISQHTAAGAADVTDLISQINSNNTGQKILVAGHSDTVPMIIEQLGGGTIDPIACGEFDNLYVVTIIRWWWLGKRVRVVRLKYGSALDQPC